jgi:hypothetical protein
MSSKAIFKFLIKDRFLQTELEDNVLFVTGPLPDGEQMSFFLFESTDELLGKKIVIFAPIFDPASKLDLNRLFNAKEGPLVFILRAVGHRFGLKVIQDQLCFSKFVSADQDLNFVRSQAADMAITANVLRRALGALSKTMRK